MKDYRDILSVFLILLIVTFACLPLFKNINNVNLDWDFMQGISFARFSLDSLLRYHQFPLRTPYFGGSYPLIASAHSGFLNPLFFISILIFGDIISTKIIIFLSHLIGALGMYYLTRYVLKYNRLGAIYSSLTFCLGGYLYKMSMSRGNLSLADYFFIPLLFAFFIKAKENKKFVFFAAFILLFILLFPGGPKFAAILLFLFLFACLELNGVYLKNFLIIISFAFALGAVRIIPALDFLQMSRYNIDFYSLFGDNLLTKPALLERGYAIYRLLLTHRAYPLDISTKGYFPLYFYLGYLPLSLFIFSSLLYWRKQLRWLILFVGFALLAFGTNTPLDLFKLLQRLPIFCSMHKPAKYFIPIITFIIALGAGRFFLILERLKKRKLTSLFFVSLLIITTLDLYWTNSARRDIYPENVPQYKRQESFFQVKNLMPNDRISESAKVPPHHLWELTRPTQYELLLQNIGKINWYGNIHLGEHAAPKYYIEWNNIDSLDPKNYTWRLNPVYKGEIYFLNNPNNKAGFKLFSPNKIIAKVNVLEPDTLIINQNYDKYWRTNISRPINYNGLLAINLDRKGEYLISFTYAPLNFYLGLAVSLVTMFGMAYYLKTRFL